MLLRSLRDGAATPAPTGQIAQVVLPLRIEPDLAERAFVTPLGRVLREAELGSVVSHDVRLDDAGEPVSLILTLDLNTIAIGALEHVSRVLEGLDAPVGSSIGTTEDPALLEFGKSYGLGLYLDQRDADEDGRLDILEACTDALEGAGLYQGSCHLGDRTALYFYGDSFNRMRAAITFVMTHDPRCRNAYARRLN